MKRGMEKKKTNEKLRYAEYMEMKRVKEKKSTKREKKSTKRERERERERKGTTKR